MMQDKVYKGIMMRNEILQRVSCCKMKSIRGIMMRNEIYENEGRVLLPTEKPTVLPMQPWCSVRVREAFSSLRLGG
jgi:hypothetical protein